MQVQGVSFGRLIKNDRHVKYLPLVLNSKEDIEEANNAFSEIDTFSTRENKDVFLKVNEPDTKDRSTTISVCEDEECTHPIAQEKFYTYIKSEKPSMTNPYGVDSYNKYSFILLAQRAKCGLSEEYSRKAKASAAKFLEE